MLILASRASKRPVVGDDQRIDLDLAGVLVQEQLVHGLHDAHQSVDLRALEAHGEGHVAALVRLQTRRRIDLAGEDALGGLGGDFLDVHAAVGGGHEQHALAGAIHQAAQIQLTRDGAHFFHQHGVDGQALRAGLVGGQARAQHPGRGFAHRLDAVHQLDAAGLAAPARMHLRLHHPALATKGHRGLAGFPLAESRHAPGYAQPIGGEQTLCLIFVKIHVLISLGFRCRHGSAGQAFYHIVCGGRMTVVCVLEPSAALPARTDRTTKLR